MDFTVRTARREDMLEVYNMIQELADFEKMSNQVKINPSILETDCFSNNPAFGCFIAETNDAVVGYAIYFTSYSTWRGKSIFLEDIYVKSAYRKRGIGKELFFSVANIARNSCACRMDFHVLSWNPAIEFYKSVGAVDLTESENWKLFRLDEFALKKLFP